MLWGISTNTWRKFLWLGKLNQAQALVSRNPIGQVSQCGEHVLPTTQCGDCALPATQCGDRALLTTHSVATVPCLPHSVASVCC